MSQIINPSVNGYIPQLSFYQGILKKCYEVKLSDCTFNFEEVLNEEGNTLIYLLNTQARNRSFTQKHRQDIDELKKS
ncbi:hypothetical protein OROMI_009507 [Orobanche minor]